MLGRRSDPREPGQSREGLSRHDVTALLGENGLKMLSMSEVDGAPGEFQIIVATRDSESATDYEAMLIVEPLIKGHGHDDIGRTNVWIGFNHTKATTLELANAFNQQGYRSTAIVTDAGSVISRVSYHGLLSREATEMVLIQDIVGVASDALSFNKMYNAELNKV